jgi:hypothetical protein
MQDRANVHNDGVGYDELSLYKKSRHATDVKAVRVVQASVMVGCYDLHTR